MISQSAASLAEPWIVHSEGAVLWLRLNREHRSNAYTQGMLSRLEELLIQAEHTPEWRVMVLTGTGERAFCAGADRDELKTREWQSVLRLTSARVFERLRKSRCLTIAAINGAAMGGGLELALACDFRLAVPTARFGLPEPELGLLPAAGGAAWLADLVGLAKAKELILGGVVWDAAEAQRWGLVNEVVPPGELTARVSAWCERILNRDALALQLAKQALQLGRGQEAAMQFSVVAQSLLVCRTATTEVAEAKPGSERP